MRRSIPKLAFAVFIGAWAAPARAETLSEATLDAARALSGSAVSVPQPQASIKGVAAWEDGSFSAADGAKIHYRLRRGESPAIVLVHGRSIAGEGWAGWEDAFPGRAMLVLDRRGYGSSELGSEDMSNVGELNGRDIEKAVALAAGLNPGGKAAVVSISLGAMLIPSSLSYDQVAWVAFLNPGVAGMIYEMDPQTAAATWGMVDTYGASLLWLPAARAACLDEAGKMLIDDLISRLANQGGQGAGVTAMLAELRADEQRPASEELEVKESVWAATSDASPSFDPRIPVFFGHSDSDELIPQRSYLRFEQTLRDSGRPLRLEHWPGGHLAPLLQPSLVLGALGDFDAQIVGPRP